MITQGNELIASREHLDEDLPLPLMVATPKIWPQFADAMNGRLAVPKLRGETLVR